MAKSIMEALSSISEKVSSGELTLESNAGSSGMPSGSVVNAKRMTPESDSLRGKEFVYLNGPQQGMHEIVDYTVEMNGKYYVIFQKGIQMLVEDLNIHMTEIENYQRKVKKVDGLVYEGEADFDSIKPNRRNKTAGLEEVAPVYADNEPLPEGFESIKPSRPNTQPNIEINNPILALLNKMKNSPKNIRLELVLNIPSRSMYKMLTENFDGSEEAIIEFLTTGKNLRDFKEQFKNSIIDYYKRSRSKKVAQITEDA